MATAVFPGEFKEDFREVAKAVDEVSELGEMVECRGYYGFYAESGKLLYHKFSTAAEIDRRQLQHQGRLQESHGQLVYVPIDNPGKEINVTKLRRKE